MHAYVAWSLYHQCNIATVHAIEMVQRHADRYALSNYDRYASASDACAWMAYFREKTQHPENRYDVQNYEQLST